MDTAKLFLPGVPVERVLERLQAAGGNEIESGKLAHPESSAALAVNAFGWFICRPEIFPRLPGAAFAGQAEHIEIEYCARFPWRGGRHPWLDAAVMSATHIVGVESKRFEPFRDAKTATFSAAYRQGVWGENMRRFGALRDRLDAGNIRFVHLDAAQLIKHAYGLVTDGRRLGKTPLLFYIYDEPRRRMGQTIPKASIDRHRLEIAEFAHAVHGDEVSFASCSYREWLAEWEDAGLQSHKHNLLDRFLT